MSNLPASGAEGAGASSFHRLIRSPYLAAGMAMLFWAGSTVLVRGVRDESPPLGLSFWRTLLGAAILLPFVVRPLIAQAALVRANLKILALLSALLFVGGNAILFVSLQFTFAVNAAVINSVEPVIIILGAWLLFRDPVTRRQGFGIAVSLAGVLTLISQGEMKTLLAMDFNRGDVLVFFAYVSWGLYAVLLRRAPRTISPAVALFVMLAMGAVFLFPIYLVEAIAVRPTLPNATTLLSIGWLALFSSVLAVLAWNYAIAQLGSGRAGVFIHLIPAFTVFMAISILNEPLHLFHGSGIALIAIGIYFSSRKIQGSPGPP